MSLRIKILGSGREVGRAGIVVSNGENNLLLDYGVDISPEIPRLPEHVSPKDLSGIALTHAHLDHSGAIPLLYTSIERPLYTTPLTLELSELLIKDFLKISKYYIPFEVVELISMMRNAEKVGFGDTVRVRSFNVEVWSSGHIPGGAMFMVEVDGINVLYTGDFNMAESCLLGGADQDPFKKADILIMEATYCQYNHPNRRRNEERFIESIREVLDNNGTVLIPAFAVGRAQEILCTLCKYEVDAPIYLDGMARQASVIIENWREEHLKDPEFYKFSLGRVKKITGARMRKRVVKEPCVIVSPAGMLKGGAAVSYMERIMENPNSAVFFVSFQIPGSPGWKVLKEGIFTSTRKTGKVKARVEWFDFSSHCGRNELLKAISLTGSSTAVIIVHAEEEEGENFAEYLRDKLGREVYFPVSGDELVFKAEKQ